MVDKTPGWCIRPESRLLSPVQEIGTTHNKMSELSGVLYYDRLYTPRAEFNFFVITSLSFCDEGFGTR